ncbi:hypothetical protein VdG1_04292 [Verticillium dahliae VDG1]|nr:hypothetical protein VdG1_04292 [Verticillium dahliae VDG1]
MSLSTPPLPSGIPKQRLNHDLNSAWGAILCFDQLQAITPANPLWHQFVTNRLKLEKRYDELLAHFEAKFISFFKGFYPIDYQNSSTQAMNPVLTSKMILMLGRFILAKGSNTPVHVVEEDTVLKLVGWNQKQASTPRWALLSDSYTAVANSPSSVGTPGTNPDKGHHCGSDPFFLNPTSSQGDLRAQLEDAKESGCIGIIIEIVDGQYSGRAFDPVLLKRLRQVCAEKQLILAADETLTAIRCGAPFAFQREDDCNLTKDFLQSWFDLSNYEDVDDLPGSDGNTTFWIPQSLHSDVIERYFREALPQSLNEIARYGEILEWEHSLRGQFGEERKQWIDSVAGQDSDFWEDSPLPFESSYFRFVIDEPSRRCKKAVCELNFDHGRLGDVNGPGVGFEPI